MPRLQEDYQKRIIPLLKEKLGYHNSLAVPHLTKIVVSIGFSKIVKDEKAIGEAVSDLSLIIGQRPALRRAKKSIAGFNLRKDTTIGAMVTIRGKRMYEFLDRLVNVALPRVRDFDGLSPSSFDQNGNYSFGLEEQMVFPEIDVNKIKRVQGMSITINTTAKDRKEATLLLTELGLPLRKINEQ